MKLLVSVIVLLSLAFTAGASVSGIAGVTESNISKHSLAIAYAPDSVRLWARYCTDSLHPFGVKIIEEAGTSVEYPNYWVICQTKGTDFEWHHKWGQYCWAISPALREVWISPWSTWIACIDQGS